MLFKVINVCLIMTLIAGCGSTPVPSRSIIIGNDVFYKQLPAAGEQGMLVSCIRCGCFNSVMQDFVRNERKAYKNLYIATDTSCGQLETAIYVSQQGIDRLSEDFYNVILFKRSGDNVTCRIVETRESKRFSSICKAFFR